MRHPKVVVALVILALAMGLNGMPASGQSTSTGTVSGLVTDPTGASVAGAEVTLTDSATSTSKIQPTNEAGRYSFVSVAPGIYDLTVSKPGFKLAKFVHQKVTVGEVLTIDAPLELGTPSETVTVESAVGAELQTTNATVGTTISGKELEFLTNIGRDANALFILQPAVTPGGNVAGTVIDQNTYMLDGGNNSSDMDGTQAAYTQAAGYIGSAATGGTPSGVMPTPAESIEEFKVATNNQTADFNGSAGGQIQMVTKRGTDQWYGSAYEYYFGSNFSANTWVNNRTRKPLPSNHQNRFGASAGGPLTPLFWGGKTFFFVNYEGRRFPQVTTINRVVPSVLLRAGVVQVQNANKVWQAYNLNPSAVTVGGTVYPTAMCGASNCDPRGIGLNPTVSQIWTQFMPPSNNPSCAGISSSICDQHNTQGYIAPIRLPQSSDSGVVRLDHDFGQKWHLMASYRLYDFTQLANTQVDIGGALPGHSFGQPVSTAPRAQKPSFYVVGLNTQITPNLYNDFHYNYLRNFWEWTTAAAPPQLPGLGGAVEIGGEGTSNSIPAALIPYNVNAQSVRQRFWDGQDHMLRDDLTLIHGNHQFQFGGLYQRNFDFHQRNDNGQSTMTAITYLIRSGGGVSMAGFRPTTVPSDQQSNWDNLYAQVLGIVSLPQVVYSRSGPNLALQPLGTPAFDKSIIPSYNVYFGDTWKMRPSFTLTYGVSYMIEMPPYELDGKQVMLVDPTNKPISTEDYLAQRKAAALAGQVYNPPLGFATLRNVGQGLKYPYDPYYKGVSPRVAVGWNPRFDQGILGKAFGRGRTVIRAGYNRIYGRLNGVDLVLVPLLGTGLLQTVTCEGAVNAANAVAGNQCLGTGKANPNTAFRIQADGLVAPLPSASPTLAQPYYPGVNGNAAAGDGSGLDPRFRPNVSDQVDLTIQRELVPSKMVLEVGYIGRRIHNEWQMIDLDAVPYMTTLGGQSFAKAFANVYTALCGLGPSCANNPASAVQAQPWFESAMGGPSSAYCAGFASCTAAVVSKQGSNIGSNRVYDLWANLANQPSWTLGRTLAFSPQCANAVIPAIDPNTPQQVCSQLSSYFMNTSLGHGNYNAAFVSLSLRNWHELTARSNFTWNRSLGTGAEVQSRSSRSIVDPWDIEANYGSQDFDVRFLYNLSLLYEPSLFKGRGFLEKALDGWAIAPLFTARSGFPLRVSINTGVNQNCQSFGEMNCSSGSSWESAVLLSPPFTGGNSRHDGVTGSNGVGTNGNPATGGSGINLYADPSGTYSQFRRLILGMDHRGGAAGPLRGFPTWNLDLSVSKEFKLTERTGLTFIAQFANVLNHFQPRDPSLDLDNKAAWGNVTDQLNDPRQIEFGLRFHF